MNRKQIIPLFCGLLGCLCFGGGDWLMMYGNPVYHGKLMWLMKEKEPISVSCWKERGRIKNPAHPLTPHLPPSTPFRNQCP